MSFLSPPLDGNCIVNCLYSSSFIVIDLRDPFARIKRYTYLFQLFASLEWPEAQQKRDYTQNHDQVVVHDNQDTHHLRFILCGRKTASYKSKDLPCSRTRLWRKFSLHPPVWRIWESVLWGAVRTYKSVQANFVQCSPSANHSHGKAIFRQNCDEGCWLV